MRDRATALFVATQNGHAGIVRTLLSAGVRTGVRRIDGSSPLWIAAQMGHSDVVRILLSQGADPNSQRQVKNSLKNLFLVCKMSQHCNYWL